MLWLLIALSLFVVATILHSKHYYSASFFTLISFYEISVLIAYKYANNDTYELFRRLIPGINDGLIDDYTIAIIIFVLMFLIGFFVSSNFIRLRPAIKTSRINESYITFVSGFLLMAFGVISLIQGGGQARIAQYTSNADVQITPFHFYGIALAPLVWFYTIKNFFARNIKTAMLLIIMSLPAMLDMFIAGRRQMFAPLVFLLLYFLLLDKTLSTKKKLSYLFIFGLSVLTLFSIQFSLRLKARMDASEFAFNYSDFSANILLPQIGEFIGSGATGLAAYRDFIFDSFMKPLGFESWIAFYSKSIPIVGKTVSAWLTQGTSLSMYDFTTIAPFGALTVSAEGIVFLGIFGLLLYGLILGLITPIFDNIIQSGIDSQTCPSYLNVTILCIASIIFFKYRSGLADGLMSAYTTLLIYFLVYLAARIYAYVVSFIVYGIKK